MCQNYKIFFVGVDPAWVQGLRPPTAKNSMKKEGKDEEEKYKRKEGRRRRKRGREKEKWR